MKVVWQFRTAEFEAVDSVVGFFGCGVVGYSVSVQWTALVRGWAIAPLRRPGRPRAADAVPSASTPCLRTVRVRPSWPTRTASRIHATGSWPNVKASALRIARPPQRGFGLEPLCFFERNTENIHAPLAFFPNRYEPMCSLFPLWQNASILISLIFNNTH